MAQKLQYIWNRIPKTICKNLVRAFDEKINLLGKDGERVNKRDHKIKKSNYTWKNNWNKTDQIGRIVYNEKVLANMKKKKIKDLRKEIKKINLSISEEKQRYSKK